MSWQLDLQAESVTPTSHLRGSARFYPPGRRFHRHPNHHQQAAVPYHPYAPPPEGYVLQERANRALVWSGALLFGLPYAVGLTYAVVADFPAKTEYLAIPVVGPWLTRAEEKDRASRVVLGLNGLTQAAGAVLFTLGLTLTRKEWVPYNTANVWVVPAATAKGEMGLVAGGSF